MSPPGSGILSALPSWVKMDGMNSSARHVRSAAVALAAALALAGCSSGSTGEAGSPTSPAATAGTGTGTGSSGEAQSILAAHGLGGLDTRAVIEKLDETRVADRPTDLVASVRPASLVLAQGGGEKVEVPIEGEQFYLSIAPYVNRTHECHFHSLTTCLGELRGEPVHLKITRADTGEVLVDQDKTTFDNGFVAAWVPRDISADVTITHAGKTNTTRVTTGPQDATCLTTMQLT